MHPQLVVAALALGALACWQQAAAGQFVEPRATDKLSPASASPKAAVYQRHLSPHRMMHFGKRPVYQSAPLLLTPAPSELPDSEAGYLEGLQFLPQLVSLSVERGQALQPYPPLDEAGALEAAPALEAFGIEAPAPFAGLEPMSRMRYIVDAAPTGYLYPGAAELPFQQPQSHLRARATLGQLANNLSRQQQQQQQAFNAKLMSTSADEPQADKRSVTSAGGPNPARASVGFLTKYTNALPYIKKADTKDNFFMHFGRK